MRKIFSIIVALAMVSVLAFTGMAFAEPGEGPNEIGGDNLPAVWGTGGRTSSYTVTQSCTIEDRVEVRGRVTLTLNDGVTLTLPNGIRLLKDNSLTVNSQSQGVNMGRLVATGADGNAAIGGDAGLGGAGWEYGNDGDACGHLILNGGAITAKGLGDTRGFGGGHGGRALLFGGKGGAGGWLTIRGGVFTVSSESGAAIGGGTGGAGGGAGAKGSATELTLDAPITVKAGADADHATDTAYKAQRYAKFKMGHRHLAGGKLIEFEEWTSGDSLPTTAGNYYLAKDVVLTDAWVIPKDIEISLCLNGHAIRQTKEECECIRCDCLTFNLFDCNGDGCTHEGYVDGDGLWHPGAGEGVAKDIAGGVIAGGGHSGILVGFGSTFNMYGGTFAGNKDSGFENGGGVSNSGTFNMYGGTICNCVARWYGGGVYNRNVMNMYGGMISDCVSGYDGGGAQNDHEAYISGGTITNNTAKTGGGVYVFNNCKIVVGGSAVIQGNASGNLRIENGNLIDIGTGDNGADAPTKEMKVGITNKEGLGAFTKECADYSANFTADSSNFKVAYNSAGKYLELARKNTSGISERDEGERGSSPSGGDAEGQAVSPDAATPATGDSAISALWLAALGLVLAGLGIVFSIRRKGRE